MSKTFKHQRNYDYHKWWRDNNPFGEWAYSVKGDTLIKFLLPPAPEIRCPFPDHLYYSDDSRKSKYYRTSYQKLRHKWTRLLHENDEWKIGKESLKPENQDYNIW